MGRWSEYDDELDEPMSAKQFARYRDDPVAFAEVVLGVELSKHAAEMLRLRSTLDDDEPLSRVCDGCGERATQYLWGRPYCAAEKCFNDCYPVRTMHRYYANRGECMQDDKGNFHRLECVSFECPGCGPQPGRG